MWCCCDDGGGGGCGGGAVDGLYKDAFDPDVDGIGARRRTTKDYKKNPS
jgi:hypothetical protein